MACVRNALIIGGGIAGMSAAIQFRTLGLEVDLIELDPGWRSDGAGITLNAATLRAFSTLGVLAEIAAQGDCHDGVDLYDADGTWQARLPTPHLIGDDAPGEAAIMRPVLAKILAAATRAADTRVRLGCGFESLEQNEAAVEVRCTDGTRRAYDLVVGADGLQSRTRGIILPEAPKPSYSGQGVWRALLHKPAEIVRPTMFMGDRLRAGLNPVSRHEMYLFVTERRPTRSFVPEAELLPQLKSLLGHFGASALQHVRAELSERSQIVFRPLDALLLPPPWYRGRIVLIGDAAHATTPHMAAGAGMGVEDALVLAESIGAASTVSAALESFQARRWPRCRMVVQNSLRLGEIEASGGSPEEHALLMRQTIGALAQPI